MFHVFASLAEFERSIIKERTTAGLASARARGRLGGRPPKLDKKDIEAAKALLTDNSATVGEIAKRLEVSKATLYRYLPAGKSEYGK